MQNRIAYHATTSTTGTTVTAEPRTQGPRASLDSHGETRIPSRLYRIWCPLPPKKDIKVIVTLRQIIKGRSHDLQKT